MQVRTLGMLLCRQSVSDLRSVFNQERGKRSQTAIATLRLADQV